jgi:hypothetical protein
LRYRDGREFALASGWTPPSACCAPPPRSAIAGSPPGGRWTLGMDGAALQCNPGARAMISHHALLYADLADPLALLRADRKETTALSDFWTYARASATGGVPPGRQGDSGNQPAATAYSALDGSLAGNGQRADHRGL